MTSGWKIDDIELPMPPIEDLRDISRDFEEESIFQFFPELKKSTSTGADYTITGLIWPIDLARELEQLCRNPETKSVTLTVPAAERLFTETEFAVKGLSINRRGPLFIKENGITYQVVPFVLTLTAYTGDGENTNETDGTTEEDEDALGLRDLNNFAKNLGADSGELGPIEIINSIFALPLAL